MRADTQHTARLAEFHCLPHGKITNHHYLKERWRDKKLERLTLILRLPFVCESFLSLGVRFLFDVFVLSFLLNNSVGADKRRGRQTAAIVGDEPRATPRTAMARTPQGRCHSGVALTSPGACAVRFCCPLCFPFCALCLFVFARLFFMPRLSSTLISAL